VIIGGGARTPTAYLNSNVNIAPANTMLLEPPVPTQNFFKLFIAYR
jgi:hypothetical protein